MTEYVPPTVWTWDTESGGTFASINRPVAGATHDKELPVGKHPLQLYSLATPNGQKVTILLEELLALGHTGAEYDAWLIKIGDGDQFGSGFVSVNPNSKIPALMDHSGATPIRVFESGAILQYLAEKFGAFLPTEPAARAECLSWLFWQMGSAPYLGGGFGALLPSIVPSALFPRAVASSQSAQQLATIVAPALGGLLYAFGSVWVYGPTVVLYLIACGLTLNLPARQTPLNKGKATLDSLLAGIRFIRSRPDILGAISLDLFAVLLGGATALLPVFAKDILLTGAWGLGLLRSAPAVGALLMSLWLARFSVDRQVGRVMFTAVGVFGVATIAFGLSTSFWFSLAVLVVLGAADMISMVIRASFVQLETPDEMRGRVSAVNGLFIGASNQLGEFESGITAHWFGTVPAVVMGGIGTLVVTGVWIKLFPTLANRDRMHVPVEEAKV